jgi:hypothetical protein
MSSELWPFVFYAALAAGLAAMIFGRALVFLVLEHWGKSARGEVVACTEHDDDGSVVYLVTYEFSLSPASGVPAKRLAKQGSRRAYSPKDIIAVRYWPTWPWVSRFVERIA